MDRILAYLSRLMAVPQAWPPHPLTSLFARARDLAALGSGSPGGTCPRHATGTGAAAFADCAGLAAHRRLIKHGGAHAARLAEALVGPLRSS
jgi:hypothetical protein